MYSNNRPLQEIDDLKRGYNKDLAEEGEILKNRPLQLEQAALKEDRGPL
jgi:hypothetical protein